MVNGGQHSQRAWVEESSSGGNQRLVPPQSDLALLPWEVGKGTGTLKSGWLPNRMTVELGSSSHGPVLNSQLSSIFLLPLGWEEPAVWRGSSAGAKGSPRHPRVRTPCGSCCEHLPSLIFHSIRTRAASALACVCINSPALGTQARR